MFLVEGEWSGYSSAQKRVVHRRYYPANRKRLVDIISKLGFVPFSDGTWLTLRVSEVTKKTDSEIRSYDALIEDAAYRRMFA